MVWRSLVMRTRSSRAASSGGGRARGDRRRRAAARRAAPARRRAGAAPWRAPQHVALEDLAALAGAGDQRRDRARSSAAILAAAGRGRHRGRRGGGRLARRGGRRRAARRGAAARAAGEERAEQRADRDRLARLGGDFRQHAGGRRVDLERHLVGLQFDQRFVRLHDVAALLEPFADGRFGDRLAEGRDANFCGHGFNAPRAAPFLSQGVTEETGARGSAGRSEIVGIRIGFVMKSAIGAR